MADLFDKEELGVVNSLFGTSPEMLNLARENTAYSRGTAAGPNLLGGILGQAGAFAERGATGLRQALGQQTPEEQLAGLRQQAQQQFDTNTPQGLAQAAQFLNQQGDAVGARQMVMLAQGQAMKQQQLATLQSQETRNLREPGRNVFSQLLSSGKYTPASVGKFQETQNPADLVLIKGAGVAGEGGGVAGPVGKSGAWRDADGTIYSASEMAKQRAGFQSLEKLADSLNMIKPEDIKKAESWIDYTSGETLKTLGGKVSPDTIQAQSRINAAQLLKQIESLPPGSASNADMISAKSSFPGYGNAKNLEAWVTDTKTKLSSSMQRQSEQYGFKPKVTVEGIGTTADTQKKEALAWIAANPNDPRVPAIQKKLGL